MKNLLILSVVALTLAGCGPRSPTADETQRAAQEALSQQGNSAVGMPAINNFQRKRILKQIMEMTDNAVTTYTYLTTRDGKLVKVCDSIGYAIPAATQYTNPQRVEYYTGGHVAALPQADPDGLFSPATAEGTFVVCKDPHSDKTGPVYFEPRITVSPFPLN